MTLARAKSVTLELTPWQKRMVVDFSGKEVFRKVAARDVSKLQIQFRLGDCLASYKLPAMGMRLDDWVLYLTDEQTQEVSRALGVKGDFSAVNMTQRDFESGNLRYL